MPPRSSERPSIRVPAARERAGAERAIPSPAGCKGEECDPLPLWVPRVARLGLLGVEQDSIQRAQPEIHGAVETLAVAHSAVVDNAAPKARENHAHEGARLLGLVTLRVERGGDEV